MQRPNSRPYSIAAIAVSIALIYAGIVSTGLGLYYSYLSGILGGLAAIAAGLTTYFISSVRNSQRQARALANLVFHEKVAIMSSYLGKQRDQLEHDREAALEFESWANDSLKSQFEDVWQQFYEKQSRLIVVKIGGTALGGNDTTVKDIVALQQQGYLLVVVHGGGNRVTQWLEKMNVGSSFVGGLRVTDEATLEVVVAVLAGLVNKELVAAINSAGGKAIGLSGIDGGLIEGKMIDPQMGYTGEVVKVNPEPLAAILSAGYVPVVSPGGFGPRANGSDSMALLNINADVTASEIAFALKAERLIFLTDVPGVQDGSGLVVPTLSPEEAKALIESGVIKGGMIPKVEGCLRALPAVSLAQIIDGREGGALLAAMNNSLKGTVIEQ